MKKFWPVVILVVLLIVWFLVQKHDSSISSPKYVDNFLGIDTSAVDKIVIRKLGSQVTLNRVGDNWLVSNGESHPADKRAVKNLVETIGNLRAGDVISDNPANQIKFQVDTLTGTKLELYTGDNMLASLFIGKMSGDFRNTYVRRSDENDVYLARGMLTHMVNRTPNDWRDKTIFDINTADVKAIECMFGEEHYTLELADSIWRISKPPFDKSSKANQDEANSLLRKLCQLKASDFARPADSTRYDFDKKDYSATILLSDGSSQQLEVAAASGDSNRRYARVVGKETVYVLYRSVVESISKPYENLVAKEKNG